MQWFICAVAQADKSKMSAIFVGRESSATRAQEREYHTFLVCVFQLQAGYIESLVGFAVVRLRDCAEGIFFWCHVSATESQHNRGDLANLPRNPTVLSGQHTGTPAARGGYGSASPPAAPVSGGRPPVASGTPRTGRSSGSWWRPPPRGPAGAGTGTPAPCPAPARRLARPAVAGQLRPCAPTPSAATPLNCWAGGSGIAGLGAASFFKVSRRTKTSTGAR